MSDLELVSRKEVSAYLWSAFSSCSHSPGDVQTASFCGAGMKTYIYKYMLSSAIMLSTKLPKVAWKLRWNRSGKSIFGKNVQKQIYNLCSFYVTLKKSIFRKGKCWSQTNSQLFFKYFPKKWFPSYFQKYQRSRWTFFDEMYEWINPFKTYWGQNCPDHFGNILVTRALFVNYL